MNSLSCAKKLIPLVPKYVVVQHTNEIPSIYFPSQRNRIAQPPLTQVDRLHLSWFESTWKKTKNMVLDNWESAGLIKRRKPDDENRKSGVAGNVNQDDNTELPENDISKAKNKAQRHLAENWDAIKRANAKTNRSLVDYSKENAATTIDELSKSAKETAGKMIDDTTQEIKSRITQKADYVKGKISGDKLVVDETTNEIKSKVKETVEEAKELKSKIQEKADDLKGKFST